MRSPLELLRRLGDRDRADADRLVPPGSRVYAVGDIHGRVDLLASLHDLIEADAHTARINKTIVYLGDYVDRGHDSQAVIDLLLDSPLPDFECVYLKGNHEDAMLRFLEDPAVGPEWFAFGGDATALSYGVRVPRELTSSERFDFIRHDLAARVPKRHFDFFSNLELMYEAGSYVFVHAGIRPNRPLHEQDPEDLLWIREEFHQSKGLAGKIIVHGHSPRPEPDVHDHRIGIDTGAYYSNVLTCLILEGSTRRFLSTPNPSK